MEKLLKSSRNFLRYLGVLLFAFLTSSLTLRSQNVESILLKSYPAGSEEVIQLKNLIELEDGYIIAADFDRYEFDNQAVQSFGGTDYWVIRTDRNFNSLWQKSYGGNDHDILSKAIKTSDGGYLLVGYSWSGISGNKTAPPKDSLSLKFDIWVVKIDSQGTMLWDKALGGIDIDWARNVIETSDGGYMIVGSSSSPKGHDKSQDPYDKNEWGEYNSDVWVIKINKNGEREWDKIYGGSATNNQYDNGFDILLARDGNYLISSTSYTDKGNDKSEDNLCVGCNTSDFWVLKIKPDGTKIWDKSFGAVKSDYNPMLEVNNAGGYFVCGTSNTKEELGEVNESQVTWNNFSEDGQLINEKVLNSRVVSNEVNGLIKATEKGYYVSYYVQGHRESVYGVNFYDWSSNLIWSWETPLTEFMLSYPNVLLENQDGEIILGVTEDWGAKINFYRLKYNKENINRIEAENYISSVDVGKHPIRKLKSPIFSSYFSASIFDVKDKIKLVFTSNGNQVKVKARVRSGAYSLTSTWANPTSFWPNGYKFYLDGSLITLTGSNSTVSDRNSTYGGSFWGTMESLVISLPAGEHTIEIESNKPFGGVDYIEIETLGEITTVPAIADKKIFVAPIPVKNKINVYLTKDSGNASFVLTDTYGNEVKRGEVGIKENKLGIDVSSLQLKQGLYIVKVKTSTGEKSIKILKD